MDRERADTSLHRRLMSAIARSARVQEDSRRITDAFQAVDARLLETLASTRRGQDSRACERSVRIRTGR